MRGDPPDVRFHILQNVHISMQECPGPHPNNLTISRRIGEDHTERAIAGNNDAMMPDGVIRRGMNNHRKQAQGQHQRVQDVKNFQHNYVPPGTLKIRRFVPTGHKGCQKLFRS